MAYPWYTWTDILSTFALTVHPVAKKTNIKLFLSIKLVVFSELLGVVCKYLKANNIIIKEKCNSSVLCTKHTLTLLSHWYFLSVNSPLFCCKLCKWFPCDLSLTNICRLHQKLKIKFDCHKSMLKSHCKALFPYAFIDVSQILSVKFDAKLFPLRPLCELWLLMVCTLQLEQARQYIRCQHAKNHIIFFNEKISADSILHYG